MRTWLGAALALALGCSFDEGGIGGSSAGLGSTSGGTTADTGGAAPTTNGDPPTTSSGNDGVDATLEAGSVADTSQSAGEASSSGPGPCAELQWWDGDWTRRRLLAMHGNGLPEPFDDAVVMLRIDPERIDYAQTRPAGDDLRFVIDGFELAYEIERWNPRGISWVWLRLPWVAPEGEAPVTIAMYYGNAGAPAGADAITTWEAGYVSVHHLEGLADSTGNGHGASSPAQPEPSEGLVAGAQHFDGADDHLILEGEPDYDFTDQLTVEALVRVDVFDVSWQAIVTKGDDAWRMHRQDWTANAGFGSDTATTNDNLGGTIAIDDDWRHVAIVYGDGLKRIYVDGVLDVEQAYAGPLRQTDDAVMIGANAGAGGRNFDGRIDEVRISAVARPPGYLAWHARSLRDDVVQWGPEESCE